MIAADMGKSTSHHNGPLLAAPVEDEYIDIMQVGYNASKLKVKTPLFNLIEIIVDQ